MGFLAESLLPVLREPPAARRCWVAYSGGVDSTVLLHALAQMRPQLPGTELVAVHVDHGLQPDSADWASHCVGVCRALGVPCHTLRVQAKALRGQSPEAAAREARYRALADLLGEDQMLCTAHHQDDQAETLLLQLLRGAGPAGLSGMAQRRRFGRGWLIRPLLAFTRTELRDFARARGLTWVEDTTNSTTTPDRNYLRHEVMPVLRARWPGLSRVLARSAKHCAECTLLGDRLAESDLAAVAAASPGTLAADRLLALDAARQRNVLRFWLRAQGLPMPPAARLESLRTDLLSARADRNPVARWTGAEVRRYQGCLHAMEPLPPHDRAQTLGWDLERPLALPHGTLSITMVQGGGLAAALRGREPVTVRFRCGGERCRPAGRRHAWDLKRLLQESGIPPWERDRIPLVYLGRALAAVGDLWVCEPFAARASEQGLVLSWRPRNRSRELR